MSFTLVDCAVLVSELGLLVIVYLILGWFIRIVSKRLGVLPGLKSRSKLLLMLRDKALSWLLLLLVVGCLFILLINTILLYNQKELLSPTLAFIRRLPPQFWQDLGKSTMQSALVLGGAAIVQKSLDSFLKWLRHQVQSWQDPKITELERSQFFELFQQLRWLLSNGTWLFAFFLCSRLFVLATISEILFLLLKIYLIFAAGLLLSKAAKIMISGLDQWSEGYLKENNSFQAYGRLRTLIPFLHRCSEYVIYIGTATMIVAQIEPLISLTEFGTRAIKILGIILSIRILMVVSTIFLTEFLIRAETLSEEQHKRRMTLIPILQSTLKYGFFFWAGILILKVIAIDPTPILAAAGIVGLAVGLGAQNLINDTVSGFFILLENYFLVGDYIVASDAEGLVESIELRTTRIRHPNGQLQILRNGDITSIVNYSRDYIYAVVDVGVAYNVNLNQVYQVLESVGKTLQEMFPEETLEPLEVDGVEEFGQTRIIVRVVTKLKPNDSRRGIHDDVQGELRKLLKEAFDREGIIIPAVQSVGLLSQ